MKFNEESFIEELNKIYNHYDFNEYDIEHLKQYLKYLEFFTIDEYYKNQIKSIRKILK